MTLQEISDMLDSKLGSILDSKLDEKLGPIIKRLDVIETNVGLLQTKIDLLQNDMTNVLSFVSTGNEDLTKKLKALKKVSH